MSEPLRLTYPTPHWRALGIGAILGIAISVEKVWEGRFIAALVALVLFTGVGYGLVRALLKTVVHAHGFVIWGWREVDWADVSAAAVLPTGVRLEFRKGRAIELPRAIAEDPAFREAMQGWLSGEHPVRRAMEQYYELRAW